MEVETEAPPSELAAVLEHAALMAKQLPSAVDPSQLRRIHAALHAAHHRLSLFLSPENSVSSAVGGGEEDGEPMQMEDDDGEEEAAAATSTVEKVAWRMRECFIQNKRPKRQLSPSAATEQCRSFADEAAEFDPLRTKLRALDLIYQFHA